MSGRLWRAAVAAALVGVACWTPVVEVRCQTDQDCGSGWRCVERQCVQPGFDAGTGGGAGAGGGGIGGGGGAPACTEDRQCGRGSRCCDGACQAGVCCSPTGEPSAVPECRGLICDQGSCVPCTEDVQCGPSAACCKGVCFGDVSCGAGGGPGGGIGGGGGAGGGTGTPVAAGSPCSGDTDCQPPLTQFCIPTGPSTGYPGGFCSAVCDPSLPCASGVCVTASLAGASVNLCAPSCSTPGQGRGSCRTGYVCVSAGASSAAPGFCRPRCDNGGLAACGPTQACNTMTGYCQ